MSREDEIYEYANMALISAEAQGQIFQALIKVLKDSGKITEQEVAAIFHLAAASVGQFAPTNDLEMIAIAQLHQKIAAVALGFGVEIGRPASH